MFAKIQENWKCKMIVIWKIVWLFFKKFEYILSIQLSSFIPGHLPITCIKTYSPAFVALFASSQKLATTQTSINS